jgi:hypothetical protein
MCMVLQYWCWEPIQSGILLTLLTSGRFVTAVFGIDDYVVIEPCAGFWIIIISSTTVYNEHHLSVEPSSTTVLYLVIIRHLWIPSFLRSSTTPSIYRSLGLPILLLSSSLESTILLGISLLPVLCRCPTHHNLATLFILSMSGDQ